MKDKLGRIIVGLALVFIWYKYPNESVKILNKIATVIGQYVSDKLIEILQNF